MQHNHTIESSLPTRDTTLEPSHPDGHWLFSPRGVALCAFLAVAAFYLWTEHRAHLLGFLPYAIFLICPLMHFFMHRGHGGHGGHTGHNAMPDDSLQSGTQGGDHDAT
jgi:hypothetical protein